MNACLFEHQYGPILAGFSILESHIRSEMSTTLLLVIGQESFFGRRLSKVNIAQKELPFDTRTKKERTSYYTSVKHWKGGDLG